jgi:hypothetical protein
MIKIPYGLSDFETLRRGDFFYQDRTQFIETLEKWNSRFPIFLRPRRFGKSLFVSTLHYYYGVEYRDKFHNLFDGLYIGQHPTALANSYFVLRFEFSGIDTATYESTYKGFRTNVLIGVLDFMRTYKIFTDADIEMVSSQESAEAIVRLVLMMLRTNPQAQKVYVLIDEYDQFANELLSFDMSRFKTHVSRNGFVRKFYENLKKATGDGIVDRVFITGVSPITMDSLSSGFNITDNISTNPVFNDMMGFTHAETMGMLVEAEIPAEKQADMMADLASWYDGYQFSDRANGLIFNPDMLLYFLKEYNIRQTYPPVMLDVNIVSDYRKIRALFKIGSDESERLELLQNLTHRGYVDFELTQLYNLEQTFSDENFLSLLYYMGMLTYQQSTAMEWRCVIPNYVIKKLYFEYFAALHLEKTQFAKSNRPIKDAVINMVMEAEPEDFFNIVAYVLRENHSNRDDMKFGEKHIQTLMKALLFPYPAYKIHSEYETGRGYADIFLERVPDGKMAYEVFIELKYVKKSAADTLETVIAEAQTQVKAYKATERFSRTDVRGFYCIFLGGEVYKWGRDTD